MGQADGGSVDTGAKDAGPIDTGLTDSGPADTGSSDTGSTDTGAAEVATEAGDAAATDATIGDSTTGDATSGDAVATDATSGESATDSGPAPVVYPIFTDAWATGLTYADFGGATASANIDTSVAHSGAASLRLDEPTGNYIGGNVVAAMPPDLSGFNALTFWAKADVADGFDKFGFGSTATSAEYTFRNQAPLPLTTTWTKFVVPLPNPAKATSFPGVFFFANGGGKMFAHVWIDDVQFETVSATVLGAPAAYIATETPALTIGGADANVDGARVDWPINGTVTSYVPDSPPTMPWFDYDSTMPSVASVSVDGVIHPLAAGTTVVTATLAGVAANGSSTVTVTMPTAPLAPTTAAPTPPARASGSYLSVFNSTGTYTNHSVDNFHATWCNATLVNPYMISGGGTCLEYTGMGFLGMESYASPLNAGAFTTLHVDVWSSEITTLGVKLVDFTTTPVRDPEVKLSATTTPAYVSGSWQSLEIPLSMFPLAAGGAGCTAPACAGWVASNIQQILFVNETAGGTTGELFIDNLYFH